MTLLCLQLDTQQDTAAVVDPVACDPECLAFIRGKLALVIGKYDSNSWYLCSNIF